MFCDGTYSLEVAATLPITPFVDYQVTYSATVQVKYDCEYLALNHIFDPSGNGSPTLAFKIGDPEFLVEHDEVQRIYYDYSCVVQYSFTC